MANRRIQRGQDGKMRIQRGQDDKVCTQRGQKAVQPHVHRSQRQRSSMYDKETQAQPHVP